MKTSFLAVVLLSSIMAGAQAAGVGSQTTANQANLPAPTAYSVVEQGANSRVWERTVYEPGPNGTIVPKKHRYTELSSGLNFWQSGQWQPARAAIDLLPPGGAFAAAATNGQHQAWFPLDIAQGTIQLSTPDGRQLASRPVGLFFEDDSNSVLFAVLTNSVGELAGSNEVIYPNAFEGATANLRYRYSLGGFEQDVVVQGQLPDPASLGLVPARARLGVLTAFFDTNNPVETPAPADPQDGLSDTTLSFGTMMEMTPGRAFVIGDTNQSNFPQGGTRTYKSWLDQNGKKFLLEEVPYPRVAPQLEQLPMSGMRETFATNLFAANSILNRISARRPATALSGAPRRKMRLARDGGNQKPGLVLDYVTLNTGLTNQVFQADSTYYVSGNVTLAGTNAFEGGAVIKFARGTGISVVSGALANWLGGAYRPVVFTAKDDNTLGEPISGSTGSPSGYYANAALSFLSATIPTLSNLRIAYAQTGILTSSGSASPAIDDGQFVNCQYAAQLSGTTAYLRNVLFGNVLTNFVSLSDATVNLQNATFNNVVRLSTVASGTPALLLTNCILANVTNNGSASVTGGDNGFYNSTAFGAAQYTTGVSPFQIVGAGSYYLTASNSFRNAGTTNIDPVVLADLAAKTTYPPIVYSNVTISVPTAFSPQAQRDNGDAPDLGYHYDPLDYVFGGVEAQSNITLNAGTAVGWFDTWSGSGYGMILDEDVIMAFNGTATEPCWMARYDTVQEGGNGNWKDTGYMAGVTAQSSSSDYTPDAPQVVAHFSKFSSRNYSDLMFRDDAGCFVVRASDCEFWAAAAAGYDLCFNFTNCLFFRIPPGLLSANNVNLTMLNCTVKGGDASLNPFTIDHGGTTWPVLIVDCTFDGTSISMDDNSGGDTNITFCDFNAFLTNADRLAMIGPHDVIVTNYNWQSSWFGNYYLPTNSPLINAGAITADLAGLYHFTTQTNQVVETNSIVDIGYHYVATDAYGNPVDTNGDGIPDYLEDANGNGAVDSGEIGWNIFGDPGLNVIITRPRNGSSLP